MSIQALLEAINKGTVAIPKALNANTRSQAEGLFNQASQMRTSALNEPAPELGNLLGSGDTGAAIAIGIARLLGIASDKDVAQFGGAYLGQKENTRQQKYKTSTDAYNRKTQGAFLNAQALEGRGGRLREDVNRKEDLTYRDTRAKVSDNQFDRSLGQSADQFNTNLDYRKGRDVKDDAFRDTAWKYGLDRDQKLDTAAAEESKWKREIWQKEFENAEKWREKEFKRLEGRDKQAVSEFKANLRLGYAQLARRATEFNEGMTLDRDKFTWQKEITGTAGSLKAAEGAFDKITANLKKVDEEIDRLMKANDAEIKARFTFSNSWDALRGMGKAVTQAPSAGMTARLSRIEVLKARQAQLIEELNKTSAAAGFAPVGGSSVKEKNGTLDFGDGVTSTRVK